MDCAGTLHNEVIGKFFWRFILSPKHREAQKGENFYYNYLLCKVTSGCFLLWHKWNGGGGWSEMFFCFCVWISSLFFMRNEKKQCVICMRIAKNMT